ncbi:MAG: single-stranded DNA-binding protein, partial [Clostridia bacterium]|nr:single-stranded DNA-binding protein [Clostridia bacterium]
GTAETICKHFYKGRQIIVDGKLDTNTYTDKNGIKRTDVFVVVREIDFCDKKNDEENQKDFENALNDIEPPLPID